MERPRFVRCSLIRSNVSGPDSETLLAGSVEFNVVGTLCSSLTYHSKRHTELEMPQYNDINSTPGSFLPNPTLQDYWAAAGIDASRMLESSEDEQLHAEEQLSYLQRALAQANGSLASISSTHPGFQQDLYAPFFGGNNSFIAPNPPTTVRLSCATI